MVIKKTIDISDFQEKFSSKLKELEGEISILHALGVEDYEIEYLVHLRRTGKQV